MFTFMFTLDRIKALAHRLAMASKSKTKTSRSEHAPNELKTEAKTGATGASLHSPWQLPRIGFRYSAKV